MDQSLESWMLTWSNFRWLAASWKIHEPPGVISDKYGIWVPIIEKIGRFSRLNAWRLPSSKLTWMIIIDVEFLIICRQLSWKKTSFLDDFPTFPYKNHGFSTSPLGSFPTISPLPSSWPARWATRRALRRWCPRDLGWFQEDGKSEVKAFVEQFFIYGKMVI